MTYSIHVTRGFHVRRPLACWSRLRFQQYSSTARVPRYLEPDLMALACTSNRKGRLHERNMRLGLHVRSQSAHSLLSLAPYLSRRAERCATCNRAPQNCARPSRNPGPARRSPSIGSSGPTSPAGGHLSCQLICRGATFLDSERSLAYSRTYGYHLWQ